MAMILSLVTTGRQAMTVASTSVALSELMRNLINLCVIILPILPPSLTAATGTGVQPGMRHRLYFPSRQ